MTRNIILLFYLLLAGCDLIDEDPPKIPTNIRGYFTVTPTMNDTTIDGTDTIIIKYNPRIQISWEELISDDIDEMDRLFGMEVTKTKAGAIEEAIKTKLPEGSVPKSILEKIEELPTSLLARPEEN